MTRSENNIVKFNGVPQVPFQWYNDALSSDLL